MHPFHFSAGDGSTAIPQEPMDLFIHARPVESLENVRCNAHMNLFLCQFPGQRFPHDLLFLRKDGTWIFRRPFSGGNSPLRFEYGKMRYGVLFPGELLNPGSVLLVKRAGVDFLLGFDPVPGGSLESLLLQSVVFDAEVPLLYGFSRQGRWKFWFFSPGAPGRVCQKEILSCPFSLSIEIPQR